MDSSGTGCGCSGGVGDTEKGQLVGLVKAYQRRGEQQREQWLQYVDSNYGGVRAPARHDTSTLQVFLAGVGAGYSSDIASASGCMPCSSQEDMEKSQLVMKVKGFQRQGDAQKLAWHGHCDANYG